jgi:elongation factor G
MAAAAKHDLSKIRNLGIIAHIDAGKTTTTEHVLFYAGATHRLGAVDSGNTMTDWNEEEQERGITIYSACIPFQWRDCTVNLIDTPGHVDFTAEVERSLRVLDGCVVVFDAQKGVEAQSETVWRQADKYHVPRLVFINKMDVVGANFDNAVEEVRERLEGNPVALTIPIGSGGVKDSHTPFRGIIDVIEMQALFFDEASQGKKYSREPIPAEMQATAQSWRDRLLDQLTVRDDKLMAAVLEGQEIAPDVIRASIREQTLRREIQPVLCGSGREHIGIQPLMDAATYYLPSPIERPPVTGTNPKKKDKEEKRKPDPKEPFAALVFKIVANENRELYYLRIYSGTLKPQSRPYNPGKDTKELLSKIYHTMADPTDLRELTEASAGDIVAVIGLKASITGDTLCDFQHPILLERITFAESVVSRAIEPESSADKDKLTDVLNLLQKEDPTFTWKADKDTGQTLMSGMGMLHLEIKQHRLERDFRLKIRVGQPRVSFRETLRRPVTVVGEFKHPSGGGFAKVKVKLEPRSGGDYNNTVKWDSVPEGMPGLFVAAAESGVRDSLLTGELGYPIIRVDATILDAEPKEESLSNEMAYGAAAADAIRKALRDNIVLLEPMMKLEVTVPEEFLGPITSDLNARRAEIREILIRGKLRVVEAESPLRKMFDYSDKVRSLSQGRASYTMEPHAYAPAPDDVLHAMLHPEENY